MKLNQKGIAHLAILLIVAVAAVGTVGYISYRAYKVSHRTYTSTSTTTKASKTGATQALTKKTLVAQASVAVTIKYPSNWTVSQKSNAGSSEVDILGPGKDVLVAIKGLGGLGGFCIPSEEKGTYQSIRKYSLDDPRISLITFTTNDNSFGGVQSEVVKTADLPKFALGGSVCDGYLRNVLTSDFLGQPTAKNKSIINTSIDIESKAVNSRVNSDGQVKPSARDIANFLSSSDFKTAITIVKSVSF